jgi:quercetin dioxygenase-like cupin family protein
MSMPTREPYLHINLHAEVDALRQGQEWSTGRNAKTLIKYDDFRVVLTALAAGTRIAEHRTEGRISVQGVAGLVRLHVQGQAFDLAPGMLLALDRGVTHDVEAVDQDSAFLLTIAWPR